MSAAHEPRPCVAAVMPVYNERATIDEIVSRVLASPWVAELIIVDDGSQDGTRDVLPEIAKRDRVRVFYQSENQGKGAAIRRGIAQARADIVIIQDADLEYDPGEYGKLVDPILQGAADVVFGSRFLGGPHRVLFFWHYVANRGLTTLSNMFNNLNLTDMETCYKAFRREVIQGIELEENRFGIEPEITAKIAKAGWRMYEVPIGYYGRGYEEGKKIGWKDGVSALRCIVKYGMRPRTKR
jgi:glycosyltransferase involved in cell wall biosynthesis